VLRFAAQPDKPFRGGGSGGPLSTIWVGVHDGCLQQSVQPGPRQPTQRAGEALVNDRGLFEAEMSGGGGDVPGLIGRHPTGQHRRPDQPQPVPQIQRVGDQLRRDTIGDPQYTTEFGGAEAGHGWGALPAHPDWAFGAGQPTHHDRVAGMQVGPMRRNLQPAGFGGDQSVFVGLRGS
jgi:hypothetical protein